MAIFNGTNGQDTLTGTAGDDQFNGGLSADIIFGLDGVDTDTYVAGQDGADQTDLGAGLDIVNISAGPIFAAGAGQVRLTFTSAEIGNGVAVDGRTGLNQDGGLAVRLQLEVSGTDTLSGDVARFDDEGVTFIATTPGLTFDVRDLVSGAARGDQFRTVFLGTNGADVVIAGAQADYLNGGAGDDSLSGGAGNDFLVGGAGADMLDGGDGNDSFIGGAGDDRILGGAGDDVVVSYNLSTDGADQVNLGDGLDRVTLSAINPGRILLAFTSAEVGNGVATDAGTLANQDGGLAVRAQVEDVNGLVAGAIGRFDDEGTTFVAGAGITFDVRDLVSGVQRGDRFVTATLGTSGADALTGTTGADYINAGAGADTLSGQAGSDFLVGGGGADTLDGGEDDDTLLAGAGDDILLGGSGFDTAIYSGSRSDYRIDRLAAGQVRVTDMRAGAPDGSDTLTGVEQLQFSSGAVSTARAFDSTLSVATFTYQFFTGRTPSSAGYDYLTNSASNPNDLGDAYYSGLNIENRFINFAVNLGAQGEGRAAFSSAYGSLSLADTVTRAYSAIFGAAPVAGRVDAILTADVGGGLTRAGYFAQLGGDGANGLATKAASVGFLLVEALKAGAGPYATANANFLADLLPDGSAVFNTDLLSSYARPVTTTGFPIGDDAVFA